MVSEKRKKPEKGYTYHEYARKFRPKILAKEEHSADDAYNHPLIPLCQPVFDDIDQESTQADSDAQDYQ